MNPHPLVQKFPPNTISKIGEIYSIRCYGFEVFTTVTKDATVAEKWVQEIGKIHRGNNLIVGLDLEWRSNIPIYLNNRVATIQLCMGHRCLIFQIIHANHIPAELRRFLTNTRYNFVGVGIVDDVNKLDSDWDLRVERYSDLRLEAQLLSLMNVGLKKLAKDFLGWEVVKPHHIQVSDWDNPILTIDQIQ
ncbi:3'-5' exonuclease-like [Tasmannia lanceolata]|uniref:3'-5' exonuclease-like n=1 Tax=Tasmannia lanceolata TaxID=3420 RepID=UPI004062BBAC